MAVDVRDDGTFVADRLIAGVSYRINILADGHANWHGDTMKAKLGEGQTSEKSACLGPTRV